MKLLHFHRGDLVVLALMTAVVIAVLALGSFGM